MRRCILGLAIAAIVTIAAFAEPGGDPSTTTIKATGATESSSKVQTAAQEFISLLQQEKFDDAVKEFDATMKQALTIEQLKSVWQQTLQANGKFQKLGQGRVTQLDQWDVVDTPCTFEKSTIVIRTSFNKQREIGGLFLIPTKRDAPPGDGSKVQLETANGTLFGTLDVPAGKGPWPVVLIIAGSGPTDRDGNQPFMKNDSLRLVGKALAAQGIAALRYDKRGIGDSAAAGAVEEKLRFEDYVDDAAGWVKQLRGDGRFNKIVILGHSEGSLIGILVAKREPIDALISVAGAGRDLTSLLRDQLKRNLPGEQLERSSKIIDELVAGRKVDDVPPELTVLFRPSVQPFLMTWLKYDPAKEVAEVKVPILVVQGTTDLQVSNDDAQLLAAANKGARLVTIENMNHVLKQAPAKTLVEQAASYSDASLPLAPLLMDEISAFLQSLNLMNRPRADSR